MEKVLIERGMKRQRELVEQKGRGVGSRLGNILSKVAHTERENFLNLLSLSYLMYKMGEILVYSSLSCLFFTLLYKCLAKVRVVLYM